MIPATGHSEHPGTMTMPTCTDEGEQVINCLVCMEEVRREILPPAGHSEVTETTDPNCLGEAKEIVKCFICNEEISMRTISTTEKGEHVENDTSDACSVCGAIKIASAANFSEPQFQEYVQKWYDTNGVNGDGYLTTEEREAVTEIYPGSACAQIEVLDGLQYFPNTINLEMVGLYNLEEADITALTKLDNLKINNCPLLQNLDITKNTKLQTLSVGGDGLLSLDMSKNTELKTVSLGGSVLASVSFSTLQDLEVLKLMDGGGKMGVLDLSSNVNLQTVEIQGDENSTSTTEIILGTPTDKLVKLKTFYAKSIATKEFDFSNCPNLQDLTLYQQTVNSFNIAECYAFTRMYLNACTFAENLDISGRTSLGVVLLDGTTITSGTLNVNGCSQLTQLSLNTNGNGDTLTKPNIKNIYVQNCTNLSTLELGNVVGLEKVYVKGTPATITGIDNSKIDSN